ncbi:ClpP/crotonase [Jaminaea rosea]|uniref:ClpP/crotonase n=1 Tax=Jaminaea rosea TaxID=1569628 RepID=A0A316UNK5_9BASI|nr:ClpP/crotonase [Jaminaea rosea]PWN25493.1 ClpP/crotonase [Jaminaea rosea]
MPRTPPPPRDPPKVGPHLLLSQPIPHVLHLTLNRPQAMNSMTDSLEKDLRATLKWFEANTSLWVLVLSGSGKAFCAGQDLKEWLEKPKLSAQRSRATGNVPLQHEKDNAAMLHRMKDLGGFGGLSTRKSNKPMIVAVDGLAMGGGMEIVVNMDIVVATSRARFSLPEVCRSVVAAQGGIPRLMSIAGPQLAAEMLLTGRIISAQEGYERFGFINALVDVDKAATPEDGQACALEKALEYAQLIVDNSPEAVQVTKRAMRLARDGVDESVYKSAGGIASRALYAGKNISEGLTAFKEKRKPRWFDPPAIKSKL